MRRIPAKYRVKLGYAFIGVLGLALAFTPVALQTKETKAEVKTVTVNAPSRPLLSPQDGLNMAKSYFASLLTANNSSLKDIKLNGFVQSGGNLMATVTVTAADGTKAKALVILSYGWHINGTPTLIQNG